MEVCEKWSVSLVNKGQRSRGTAAQTLCEMCSLRHPIRALLPTYPIIHQTADCFKCPGLGCYYFSSSCKKASWYINRCLVIWNIMWPFPTSLSPGSPPPPIQLCLLASQVWNNGLESPFSNKWNCLLPIGCLNSYKSWCGRGMGQWEALQLLIHYYKEVAVLFNCPSLKKHAVFAFFFHFFFKWEQRYYCWSESCPRKKFISGF